MALSHETTFRLIGGGGTRGLSGDSRRVLPPDPAFDFFDACLRRHVSMVDLVADPDQVWEVDSTGGRPMGLEAHLRAASRERLVSVTDVLIIISDVDYERANQNHGARWIRHLVGGIRASFEDWCQRAGIPRRNPNRPLGVRVVGDGHVSGGRLGLRPGEFVTGLLPNHYSGPSVSSRPLVSVMANLPGVWEGYREVARLYDDQDLLTIGNHWLDNFSHPSLVAPALYRLQYDEQEGLVHLTSPDVQGGFTLTRHGEPNSASVYGLTRGDGQVVAWLVLALVEAAPAPTPVVVEAVPTHDGLFEEGPTVADPVSSENAGAFLRSTAEAAGVSERFVTVREAGVLLQRVHFRDFMAGYEVYIGENGDIGSDLANPAATVQVVGKRVRLFAHVRGIRVGGMPVPVGAAAVLGSNVHIDLHGVSLDYRDLSGVRAQGWPYLGEIRRVGANIHVTQGAVHTIGRDPSSRVRLPDDAHHGNIIWRTEVDAGTVIRSKNGDIPKSQFTLDSIMVASQHAQLDLCGEQAVARNVAQNCFSFVRRGRGPTEAYIGLSRLNRGTGASDVVLEPGDELLVGNCVLQVEWDTQGGPEDLPTLAPPPVQFSLVDDTLDGEDDTGSVPLPPLLSVPPMPDDLLPPPPRGATSPVGRRSDVTWFDDDAGFDALTGDPHALPAGVAPEPFVPDVGELDSMQIEAVTGAAADPNHTLGGMWSPFADASSIDDDDDPTALPEPRFSKR